jgi:hypothetical protein
MCHNFYVHINHYAATCFIMSAGRPLPPPAKRLRELAPSALFAGCGMSADLDTVFLNIDQSPCRHRRVPRHQPRFVQIALSDFASAMTRHTGDPLTLVEKGSAHQFFRCAHDLGPDADDWAKPAAGPPANGYHRMSQLVDFSFDTCAPDVSPDRIRGILLITSGNRARAIGRNRNGTEAGRPPAHLRWVPPISISPFQAARQADSGSAMHVQNGPPSYQAWWTCWLVFKTTLLVLNGAPPERLDRSAEQILGLADWFGHQVSWPTYQGDMHVHQEHMARIHRRITLAPSAPPPGFATRLWDIIVLELVFEHDFWDERRF